MIGAFNEAPKFAKFEESLKRRVHLHQQARKARFKIIGNFERLFSLRYEVDFPARSFDDCRDSESVASGLFGFESELEKQLDDVRVFRGPAVKTNVD